MYKYQKIKVNLQIQLENDTVQKKFKCKLSTKKNTQLVWRSFFITFI